MLRLGKNERVDWFRITVDIKDHGISIAALARMVDIPKSTIKGWRNQRTSPRIEEAVRVLNMWSDITGLDFDDVPVYNPYLPYPLPCSD